MSLGKLDEKKIFMIKEDEKQTDRKTHGALRHLELTSLSMKTLDSY